MDKTFLSRACELTLVPPVAQRPSPLTATSPARIHLPVAPRAPFSRRSQRARAPGPAALRPRGAPLAPRRPGGYSLRPHCARDHRSPASPSRTGGVPLYPTAAAAHGPARASMPRRSRCARMRVTTACSVTNARMRISPPQRGHTSTSTANTSRSSSAQRRRRALSAGHGGASCSGSGAALGPAPDNTTPRRRHQPRRRRAYAP